MTNKCILNVTGSDKSDVRVGGIPRLGWRVSESFSAYSEHQCGGTNTAGQPTCLLGCHLHSWCYF